MERVLLYTTRLKIRNLTEEDLDAFYQYRSNPEITRYQGFDTYTREEALNFIRQHKNKILGNPGEWIQYAIICDNYLIGDCAIFLNQSEPGTAELGITISTLYQRRGFARETMQALMNYLFENKDIRRIVETVDAENTASRELMKGLGFRQEGHFIENVFFKGKWGSEMQFAMLKKDWKNQR